ncbi:histidine phosphatase family protein [Anoxynatronum sibiricum]|uniref:Histidine phosphatase family protein n=1 Tax=Anoxynatronum sibiricum TaxID=210623 RepID=A0ABU9VRX3_9CLOT
MKIMLIRHGETNHNLENRMSGWTEAVLSDKGIRQAEALGRCLAGENPDKVITSGMKRTDHTAQLVFPTALQQNRIEIMENLKEMHFGTLEGMTMDEIRDQHTDEYTQLMEKRGRYTFPGGESLYSFHHRVSEAAKELLICSKKANACQIAVVAHSGTIRSLLAHWIANDWQAHWRFQIDHCSISVISFHDTFPVLQGCNDTHHLTDLNDLSG